MNAAVAEAKPFDPARALRRALRAMHTVGIDVSCTAIYILVEISRHETITMTNLARFCFGDGRRTIQSQLYRLVAAEYITWLRPRSAGGQLSSIRITPKGRELVTALTHALAS